MKKLQKRIVGRRFDRDARADLTEKIGHLELEKAKLDQSMDDALAMTTTKFEKFLKEAKPLELTEKLAELRRICPASHRDLQPEASRVYNNIALLETKIGPANVEVASEVPVPGRVERLIKQGQRAGITFSAKSLMREGGAPVSVDKENKRPNLG